MQYKNNKETYLIKKLCKIIHELGNQNEFPTNKIEKRLINYKLTTLWKIAQILGVKLSDLIKMLEKELEEDFILNDE